MADIQMVNTSIGTALQTLYDRIRTRDFDNAMGLYTENCRIFGLDGTVFEGRLNCGAALRSIFSVVVPYTKMGHAFEELMYDVGAEYAASRDSFTMFNKNGANLGSGKSLLVWKLVDGMWYIDQDRRNYNFKTDKTQVIELSRAWANALSRKDYRVAVSYYTTDCASLWSNMAIVKGKEGLENTLFLSKLSGTVILNPDFDFRGLGDTLASLEGTSSMTDNDGKIVWHCYYQVIFKKLGGKWYIHNDIFTEIP